MTGRDTQAPRDIFVSYTKSDLPWARWIAVTLVNAGFRIHFQEWDSTPGGHFPDYMDHVMDDEITIAVMSQSYLRSDFAKDEALAALERGRREQRVRLIPIRVAECQRPVFLGSIVSEDLFGVQEEEATRRLVTAVLGSGLTPEVPSEVSAHPGRLPERSEFPGTSSLDVGSAGESGEASRARVVLAHAGENTDWAEWIRERLEAFGVSVVAEVWSWGGVFKTYAERRSSDWSDARAIVLLLTEKFAEPGRFPEEDIAALGEPGPPTFVLVLEGNEGLDTSGLTRLRKWVVPTTRDASERAIGRIRRQIVEGLPGFHGGSSPNLSPHPERHPASLPKNRHPLLTRNAVFIGRDQILADIRSTVKRKCFPHVLSGQGGVGKTALAIEYAHRYHMDYDLVWWIDASPANSIEDQLSGLAVHLGVARPASDSTAALTALNRYLGETERWLLVLDGVENQSSVRVPLPTTTSGHILITTPAGTWSPERTTGTSMQKFSRAEAVRFLRDRFRRLASESGATDLRSSDAERIAERVDDLPLALSQAAGAMFTDGLTVEAYLDELESDPEGTFDDHSPDDHVSLTQTTRIAYERMSSRNPVAGQITQILVCLAEARVPLSWFTSAGSKRVLAADLASAIENRRSFRGTLSVLRLYGLARPLDPSEEDEGHNSLEYAPRLHRLTTGILRKRLDARLNSSEMEGTVLALLSSAAEDIRSSDDDDWSTSDPRAWSEWEILAPHVEFLVPNLGKSPEFRELACYTALYMLRRGQTERCRVFANELYDRWRRDDAIGHSDQHTLLAGQHLQHALMNLGRYKEARDLGEVLLERALEGLGPDHPVALRIANGVAVDLRLQHRWREALDLDRDTLRRRKSVARPNVREILRSKSNISLGLAGMGKREEARSVCEAVWKARKGEFSEDAPATLTSKAAVAALYFGEGRWRDAEKLDRAVLATRREILGADHPDALRSMCHLAADLRGPGAWRGQTDQRKAEKRRWAESEDLDREALGKVEAVRGHDIPLLLLCYVGAVAHRRRAGDHVRVVELTEKIRTGCLRLFGVDHPDTLRGSCDYAAALRALGRWDEARTFDEEASARLSADFDPESLLALLCKSAAATYCRNGGRWDEAVDADRTVHRLCRARWGEDHPLTLAAASSLAADLAGLGKTAESRERDGRVFDSRRSSLGDNHRDTKRSASYLSENPMTRRERDEQWVFHEYPWPGVRPDEP